jgi:CheY-like chemotaxis protein
MAHPRILIADDEEGIRESLSLILGDGYELIFAKDGQETLDKLTNDSFDLVLLDIKMPKLDGLEVLRQLKAKGLTPPVFMLTAYQSVELAKEAVKLGASDYLPKPFEREQILRVVRSALDKR